MNAQNDDLDSFFISVEENEKEVPLSESLKRRGRRYVARGVESIAGLPGDLVQTIRGLSSSEEIDESQDNFAKRGARSLLEALPGSAEFRASNAEQYPELEPESQFEELEDEIVGDLAVLALPVKGKIPFARALGLSMAGNLGKEVVKEMGFSEGPQEATKMGLMLFSGMFGKGRGVNKHISNLYKEAESFVPEGARLKYPVNKLKNVEKIIGKGALTDAKQAVGDIVEEIKFKSPGGLMKVEEAIQFDKDINRAIGKAGADKTKSGYLKQLKKAHVESLNEYAKENPSWGENYKQAQQAYKGIETSQNVKNYIKRNMNLKNFTYATALLGLGGQYLPGSAGEKIGAIGSTAALLYAGTVAKRLATNPALRKYYGNVMQASLSNNKAMLSRNMAGLNRVAKKEFEDNPFPIFDSEED